jgi:hypothetical protein
MQIENYIRYSFSLPSGIHRSDYATPVYSQKLALTSPTSGDRDLCSSLNVRDQVSHPYIYILYLYESFQTQSTSFTKICEPRNADKCLVWNWQYKTLRAYYKHWTRRHLYYLEFRHGTEIYATLHLENFGPLTRSWEKIKPEIQDFDILGVTTSPRPSSMKLYITFSRHLLRRGSKGLHLNFTLG